MKAVFLDRDGVINIYPGDFKYVTSPEQFRFLPQVAGALKRLNAAGFKLFVISNQAGVGKGEYSQETLDAITRQMLEELSKSGVSISGVNYCTHPSEANCSCRKPKAGMVYSVIEEQAKNGDTLDIAKSFFIGDTMGDIETAKAAGLKSVLVFSGKEKPQNQANWQHQPDFVASGLSEAADLILRQRLKIIIPYASAGAGHFKAAEAVYNYLKQNYGDYEVSMVDVLEESSHFLKFCYTLGYAYVIRHAPLIWAIGFWMTSARFLRPITRISSRIFNYFDTRPFTGLLIRENPDYIISAHFLTSEIAARLKKTKKIASKLITVITDFGVHPFWLSDGTDIYVAASSVTRDILLKEGIGASLIRDFGIPIDAKFSKIYDKQQLCAKFGIENGKFTLLIMTGSFGIGPIEETVDLLYKEAQIIVVCAKNKKLFARLQKKNYPNVKVLAFVDNVQELMAVSDCIVTKPGGLSSCELLAMKLVPIFTAAIPGQEAANMRILDSLGVGTSAYGARDIMDQAMGYMRHPDKLNTVKEKISLIRKPNAAGELCDAVCLGRI